MAAPTLIYCGGGNRRFYEIATQAGFMYGAQLPDTVYGPLYFADQDWKKPNREMYMRELAKYKPHIASVLDWERMGQLSEVLEWAEEAAQFTETVMLIPKVQCGIVLLPSTIGGKPVRLGYSMPTKHGGTALPYSDFIGWPVHLLGGSPHAQMRATRFMNVVSTDGNMANKMAQRCRFWRHEQGSRGHWVNMYETGDGNWGNDANQEAFRRSCENIMVTWKQFRQET